MVECRTPEPEVGGSKPTTTVLCPWARHFTPRKYWLITQEAAARSRHDWKIVDWDVKPQHKQTKIFFSRTKRLMTLKFGMQHRVLEYYLIYSDDDAGLTLTYFTARSNLVPYAFVWKKGKTMDFSETIIFYDLNRWRKWQEVCADIKTLSPGGCMLSAPGLYTCIKSWKDCIKSRLKNIFLKLATNEWSDKTFLLISKLSPWGLSAPAPGLDTYIKSWKKNCIKSDFKEIFFKLATNDQSDKMFLLT